MMFYCASILILKVKLWGLFPQKQENAVIPTCYPVNCCNKKKLTFLNKTYSKSVSYDQKPRKFYNWDGMSVI